MFMELIKTVIQAIILMLILQIGYRAIVPKSIRKSILFLFRQIGLLFTKLIFPVIAMFFKAVARGCTSTFKLIQINMQSDDDEDSDDEQGSDVDENKNGAGNVIQLSSKRSKTTGA